MQAFWPYIEKQTAISAPTRKKWLCLSQAAAAVKSNYYGSYVFTLFGHYELGMIIA